MTKTVRIENADTSDYKVVVEVWDKTSEGDILVDTLRLDYPTAMTDHNCYITDSRYLVVREAPSEK